MEYKIGQILTSKEDTEVELALSDEKVIVPKGNKVVIGADGFAHYLKDGCIQPLAESIEVKGYDTEGIAQVVYGWLNSKFNLQEDMLDEFDVTEKEFMEEIEWALDEYVGM